MQQPSSSQFAVGKPTNPSPTPQQVSRGSGSSDNVIAGQSWATPGPSSSQRVMTPKQLQLSDSGNTSGLGNFSFLQDLSFGGISGGSGPLASPLDLVGGASATGDGRSQ